MRIEISNSKDFKELPLRKKLIVLLAVPLIILIVLALVILIIGFVFAIIIPIVLFTVGIAIIASVIGAVAWVLTRPDRRK